MPGEDYNRSQKRTNGISNGAGSAEDWAGHIQGPTLQYKVAPYKKLQQDRDAGSGAPYGSISEQGHERGQDLLQRHHAPNDSLTSVPRARGAAILLPKADHGALHEAQKSYFGSEAAVQRARPEEVFDHDVRWLQRNTHAPDSSIEKLRQLNRENGIISAQSSIARGISGPLAGIGAVTGAAGFRDHMHTTPAENEAWVGGVPPQYHGAVRDAGRGLIEGEMSRHL